jgi:ubiquinone/menaquinone biosynthesis C-methylase UbiE
VLKTSRAVSRLLLAALAVTAGVSAQKQDDAADTARLIEVLELLEGSRVADVGAGSGELTIRMARYVGAAGHVFSTDINPQRLIEIRQGVAQAQLKNVTIIEGASTQTNVPRECCDAVFLRHVYHHLGDPNLMNASLRASLKPGGRVAIVDFPPDNGVSAPAGRRGTDMSHGVTPETVMEELRAAGFVGVERLPWSSGGGYFLIVARRPN